MVGIIASPQWNKVCIKLQRWRLIACLSCLFYRTCDSEGCLSFKSERTNSAKVSSYACLPGAHAYECVSMEHEEAGLTSS